VYDINAHFLLFSFPFKSFSLHCLWFIQVLRLMGLVFFKFENFQAIILQVLSASLSVTVSTHFRLLYCPTQSWCPTHVFSSSSFI
jgi:hypothetical protein